MAGHRAVGNIPRGETGDLPQGAGLRIYDSLSPAASDASFLVGLRKEVLLTVHRRRRPAVQVEVGHLLPVAFDDGVSSACAASAPTPHPRTSRPRCAGSAQSQPPRHRLERFEWFRESLGCRAPSPSFARGIHSVASPPITTPVQAGENTQDLALVTVDQGSHHPTYRRPLPPSLLLVSGNAGVGKSVATSLPQVNSPIRFRHSDLTPVPRRVMGGRSASVACVECRTGYMCVARSITRPVPGLIEHGGTAWP